MRRRSPQALRFHKLNKEKSPHEYYYSELQLYYPHMASKKCSLKEEKESAEVCHQTYVEGEIFKVKSKIMPYLESVEEGLEKAKLSSSIGDELDPQKEQDEAECEAEGISDHPDFVFSDPKNLPQDCEERPHGLFKTVTLESEVELERLTSKLDDDQRLVLTKVINYARKIQISRKTLSHIQPPLIIVQGGAGAGKSLLIKAIAQWFERFL